MITKFLEFDRFYDHQFVQYFRGFELLHWWMMKHHSQVADFANLDFEAIDTKILVNKTKEKEREAVTDAVEVVDHHQYTKPWSILHHCLDTQKPRNFTTP